MSSQSGTFGTNKAVINTDVSKIFIRDNRYQKGNHLNNGNYDPLTLSAGTLMGRIGNSGYLVPLFTLAGDGSQFPVGILAHDVEIDSGETKEITIVDMGDVVEDKVILFYTARNPAAGESLDTVVSNRRLRDHLQAQGIKLITAIEMTDYDNQ